MWCPVTKSYKNQNILDCTKNLLFIQILISILEKKKTFHMQSIKINMDNYTEPL